MPARDDLEALREKYTRMIVLREAHDRAKREPAFVEPDPTGEMAAIATRFPGALREIDRLPLEVLRARAACLAIATDDPAAVEPWMGVQVAFHRLARAALALKLWLGRDRVLTDERRRAFASTALAADEDAQAFALDEIARPPGGRLMVVVRRKVAERLGLTEDAVVALLR